MTFAWFENSAWYDRIRLHVNHTLSKWFSINVFSDRDDARVLEFACGTGAGAYLISQDKRVSLSIASDISLHLFQKRKDVSKYFFVLSDLFVSGFKRESFDLVWNSSSLEHFEDPVSAVGSMSELVREGGYIFVGVPYTYGPLAIYYGLPISSWRDWIGKPFTEEELAEVMARNGLSVESSLVYGFGCFIGILGRKRKS